MEIFKKAKMYARLACATVVTGNIGPLLHLVVQVPVTEVTVDGGTVTANAGATVGNVLKVLESKRYISSGDGKNFAQCAADLAMRLGGDNGIFPEGVSVPHIQFAHGFNQMPLPTACLPHPSFAENLGVYGGLALLGIMGVGVLYLAGCMVRIGGDRPVYNETRRQDNWTAAANPQYAKLPDPRPGSLAGTEIVTVAIDEHGSTQEVERVVDDAAYQAALHRQFVQGVSDARMIASQAEDEMRAAVIKHFDGIGGRKNVLGFIDLLRDLARGGRQGPDLPTSSFSLEPEKGSGGGLSSDLPMRPGGRLGRRQNPPTPPIVVVQKVIEGGGKSNMPNWWLALNKSDKS
ncbi:MAG: hypothetical protein UU93_C0002G0043 [Candidatus Amesbacteria bacterium GW2011_GWA2_42_12]|uniref:Uncharacterized protein n=1 Tax=Candidatus Amesbacteria bacterium GW2011_GWA2_42_12 TaxID=1618356 RepID=A0A0G0Y8S4_9BACT|nr:MAG: hypothetical protein UU93_C0002G0043 [Candidatus Amesbacteria bacterium GW2011_GWA2_42_12]